MNSRFLAPVVGALSFVSAQVSALPNTADTNAEVVNLRMGCTEGGVEISNCFDNLPNLLDWIWGTRTPTQNEPLLVDIGPGVFFSKPDTGYFGGSFCNNSGFVTFRGAGMDHTTINADPVAALSGINVANCESLAFENLTIDGANALYGFLWTGDGSSTYSNVALRGRNTFGWYDSNCSANNQSEHYFFSSKISMESNGTSVAYLSSCAITWFYGSEIKATAIKDSDSATPLASQGGEIHVYGSAIRALSNPGVVPASLTAVLATGAGSEIHIHGTGIDAITDSNADVTALSAANGAFVHASESSYVLRTNGGSKTRIASTGSQVQAPFMWQGEAPPDISSMHGADMALITATDDGQPHVVIYSEGCSSKWFDSTLNQCRP